VAVLGVYELVEQASGFGSAGLSVACLMGIFTRRGGPTAAIVSMTAGLLAWIAGS
jgi:hypothetical protein